MRWSTMRPGSRPGPSSVFTIPSLFLTGTTPSLEGRAGSAGRPSLTPPKPMKTNNLDRIPVARALRALKESTDTEFSYLLSVEADAKTEKGTDAGYLTGVLYLAPATAASEAYGKPVNVCAHASEGCTAACLYTSGRAKIFETVNRARVQRTVAFLRDRQAFLTALAAEVQAIVKTAARRGLTPAIRLNGTSDLDFHRFKWTAPDGTVYRSLMDAFPDVQWYDYTKSPKRAEDYAAGRLPSNYDVTFSLSEENDANARKALEAGLRVAVVFDRAEGLPETFDGYPVVDGDKTDLRFLDPGAVVVGLKAKGEAKGESSGFVRRASVPFLALPVL
jgi:hypothetical protein